VDGMGGVGPRLGPVADDVAVAVGVPVGRQAVGVGIGDALDGVGHAVVVAVGVEVVGPPVSVGIDRALHGVVDAVVVAVDRRHALQKPEQRTRCTIGREIRNR